MADAPKAEILMTFYTTGGNSVNAEGALDIADDDKKDFMEGFRAATYQNYSNFFEVQDFDYSVKLDEGDDGSKKADGKSSAHPSPALHGNAHRNPSHSGAGRHHNNNTNTDTKEEFARWRSASDDELRAGKIKYPLIFEDFNFTRLIDAASPIFFEACCYTRTFSRAILVKRYAPGQTKDAMGRPLPARAFVRIDFWEVLITKVDWSDGDVVTEKCSFICKAMKYQYKQQRDDGTLSSPMPGPLWMQGEIRDMSGNSRRRG